MSKMMLWWAKNITKKLNKLEKDKIMLKTLLNTTLKSLTNVENIQYGYDMGFIDESEYHIQMMEAKK